MQPTINDFTRRIDRREMGQYLRVPFIMPPDADTLRVVGDVPRMDGGLKIPNQSGASCAQRQVNQVRAHRPHKAFGLTLHIMQPRSGKRGWDEVLQIVLRD